MKNANPLSKEPAAAVAVLLCLFLAACGPGRSVAESSGQKTVFDHFTLGVGGRPASLEVAVLGSEQQRGLMQRSDLGRDEGMIFVYERPQELSFWMKNTPEPLDLGYLSSDGAVREIYELLPLDERPVASHSDQMQFALEMPRGWFAANGVRPGSRIDMKALAEALRERGFDPAKYGID